MVAPRRLVEQVASAAAAGFCWLTALYAFVCASAFAYLQFIKPRVFAWVGAFADAHATLCWIWLALYLFVLLPDMRRAGASRLVASILGAAALASVAANAWQPVLPRLADGTASLLFGIAALVPVLGLVLLDHLGSRVVFRRSGGTRADDELRGTEGRLLVAALGAALLVSAIYATFAAVQVSRAFEPDLLGVGLAVGTMLSVADHALLFLVAALIMAVAGRLSRGRVAWHYALTLGVLCLGVASACDAVLTGSIGLTGWSTHVAAAVMGTSVAGYWGGRRLRWLSTDTSALTSAVDLFVLPPPDEGSGRLVAIGSAATVLLAGGFIWLATRLDWDFVVMNTGVVSVWTVSFVVACRATPFLPGLSNGSLAALCIVPLALHLGTPILPGAPRAFDRYAVHNPSFRLADAVARRQPKAPSFDRYLRDHTGLTDVQVAPASIDFVPELREASGPKPLIFLLVVDSLRPDYLSPYNPAVRFTPRIQAFADENVRFANAFTAYGGTGLSMPALWAGSTLVHKQYVEPFAPMNALEKVLDVNHYRRIVSRDHITAALWTPAADEVELNRGRAEMDFDFCETLDELTGHLRSGVARERPVFAQTRSLNLHVAAVRNGFVPPGKSYPGFEAPYAWRVERIDACFGRFIDHLKELDVYDRSLIVLTSDHGELIGEDGRWGHSYHMFPEVIQVPLLVHVPNTMKGSAADTGAVVLSTDITPTVYATLGYEPQASNQLMGRPLVHADERTWRNRRRDARVLAASYGAVYAVITDNGRRLYIADAIKGRAHAYRREGRAWREMDVHDGVRWPAELRIRRHVGKIARLYGVDRAL